MASSNCCNFQLPDELNMEIISRVGLKTLDTCKAVCKDWNTMAYDPLFVKNFYEKSKTKIFGFLLQASRPDRQLYNFVSVADNDTKFEFSPSSTNFRFSSLYIEASSLQGIVCCLGSFGSRYRFYVCKPTTNQWQKLPNPKMRYFTSKVGLVVLNSTAVMRYVIIRFSQPHRRKLGYNNYRCEIFDSSNWRWREIEEVLLPEDTFLANQEAVFGSGFICFLAGDNILAFTANGESRQNFEVPAPVRLNKCKRLIDYGGKLGLFCQKSWGRGKQELWILKDWRNNIWEKMKEIDTGIAFIQGFCNSETAFTIEYYRAVFYNLRDSKSQKVKINMVQPIDIFPFRSDFEPVNLTGR